MLLNDRPRIEENKPSPAKFPAPSSSSKGKIGDIMSIAFSGTNSSA
jgi:hypothetical protein